LLLPVEGFDLCRSGWIRTPAAGSRGRPEDGRSEAKVYDSEQAPSLFKILQNPRTIRPKLGSSLEHLDGIFGATKLQVSQTETVFCGRNAG
jgi:hypothetical protein